MTPSVPAPIPVRVRQGTSHPRPRREQGKEEPTQDAEDTMSPALETLVERFVPATTGQVRFQTLGCRLNQSESEEAVRSLTRNGIVAATGRSAETGDIVVVNTCTVTVDAARSSRKLIRKAAAAGARVVVTGCYATEAPDVCGSLPGVVQVLPNQEKNNLVDAVTLLGGPALFADEDDEHDDHEQHAQAHHAASSTTSGPGGVLLPPAAQPVEARLRSAFKVQTGCDEKCTFCIIPQTRGSLSSRSEKEILQGVRDQVATGVREVALTGVHLGKYGVDWGEPGALAGLVRAILRSVPELPWLRLSSIEAVWVDDPLLDVMAAFPTRICPYLHIPLQSGDDEVLRQMQRPYHVAAYLGTLDRARDRLGADLGLSADVLVGFPGEDDDAFARTVETVRRARLTKLHVFRYSSRPGTPAAERPDQVSESVKKQRSAFLRDLGGVLSLEFHESLQERLQPVLIERVEPLTEQNMRVDVSWSGANASHLRSGANASHESDAVLQGTTGNFVKVLTRGPAHLLGSVVTVRVTEAKKEGVRGMLV